MKRQDHADDRLRFEDWSYTDEGNRTYTASGRVSGEQITQRRFKCWALNDGSHDDQAMLVEFP
mgnify:CR=1 FL=1